MQNPGIFYDKSITENEIAVNDLRRHELHKLKQAHIVADFQAQRTAMLVGAMMAGKKAQKEIPTLKEMVPYLFEDELKKEQDYKLRASEQVDLAQVELQKKALMALAQAKGFNVQ